MTAESDCQLLPWDSDFFGRRIARINGSYLDAERLQRIIEWVEQESVECLYYLASADDTQSMYLAEDAGMRFRDIRVTFERSLREYISPEPMPDLRLSIPADAKALTPLARNSHHDTRFFADPHFSEERCASLYEIWLKRSILDNYADAVFVAEIDDRPVAYVSCHLDHEAKTGSIGILAVDESARGRGLGRHLVDRALVYMVSAGMQWATVVTQGRNIAAQRLYMRSGFLIQRMDVWYHWWLNTSDKP